MEQCAWGWRLRGAAGRACMLTAGHLTSPRWSSGDILHCLTDRRRARSTRSTSTAPNCTWRSCGARRNCAGGTAAPTRRAARPRRRARARARRPRRVPTPAAATCERRARRRQRGAVHLCGGAWPLTAPALAAACLGGLCAASLRSREPVCARLSRALRGAPAAGAPERHEGRV